MVATLAQPAVRSINEPTAAASISATLASTPKPGNLLIAVLTINNIPGTVSATPFGVAADVASPGSTNAAIYSKIAGPSESPTVTFTGSLARNHTLTLEEWAPTPGSVWLGFDQSATSSAASQTSLTVGPTAAQGGADDLAIAGFASNVTYNTITPAVSDGYAIALPPAPGTVRGFAASKTLSSAAATQVTGSWTNAPVATSAAVATYKQKAVASSAGFLALL